MRTVAYIVLALAAVFAIQSCYRPLDRRNYSGSAVIDAIPRSVAHQEYLEHLHVTDSATELTPERARELAEWAGRTSTLCLDSLTTLSPEAAKELAQFKGCLLSVGGLPTLSPEAAKELAHYTGSQIDSNTEAENTGILILGLTTLSPQAAKALLHFRGGSLWLVVDTKLDAEAEDALRENSRIQQRPRLISQRQK